MAFSKRTVLESLAVEAGLGLDDVDMENKVMAFLQDKNVCIEFYAGELCISAKSKDPKNSATSEYSERVRFDDVTEDQWGSALIVDRINAASRRCKYFTEPNVYLSGDVSNGSPVIPGPVINDATEEAEDYIVVSDVMCLFKNLIDGAYIGLDMKSDSFSFLMKVQSIAHNFDQDAVMVSKYPVTYALYAMSNDNPKNIIHVKDSTYTKFLNKTQIREFIERD